MPRYIDADALIESIKAQAGMLNWMLPEADEITDILSKGFIEQVNKMPTAQPEWNNHTVACLLAELFGDACACNYNGIDEWLPEKCELLDSCPNPCGVACWEQFLKHKAERRIND